MTTYAVSAKTTDATSTRLTVRAESPHPLRIARIEIFCTGGCLWDILHYTGSSLSSGTTLTPRALRGGAPAATFSARSGGSVSGTSYTLTSLVVGGHHFENDIMVPDGGSNSYSFPVDLVLSPGEALSIASVSIYNANGQIADTLLVIYCEEIRQLSWPL